jgi:hypothetical protein
MAELAAALVASRPCWLSSQVGRFARVARSPATPSSSVPRRRRWPTYSSTPAQPRRSRPPGRRHRAGGPEGPHAPGVAPAPPSLSRCVRGSRLPPRASRWPRLPAAADDVAQPRLSRRPRRRNSLHIGDTDTVWAISSNWWRRIHRPATRRENERPRANRTLCRASPEGPQLREHRRSAALCFRLLRPIEPATARLAVGVHVQVFTAAPGTLAHAAPPRSVSF